MMGRQALSETGEGSWLASLFQQFYSIEWSVFPKEFRKDMMAWWRRKSGAGEADPLSLKNDPESMKRLKAQHELAAVEIVKAVGYVLSPPLYIEKHGEGQVRHLDIQDVYYAKLVCKRHGVPIQLDVDQD